MSKRFWIGLLLLQIAALCRAQTSVPWLTRSGDNQRSGWNSHETTLSQASIVAKGVSLETTIPVYGDARGIEAQPLILPRVQTSRGIRDVMVLCSMANQCRGVDAHDGSDIWDVTLGMSITVTGAIDMYGINQHSGALSTGVIDPSTNRFYQVFWSSPDGTGNASSGRFYMAVLNVADGSQVVTPVMITGSSQGYDFNAQMRKARSSAVLLATKHAVLQCTGTVKETAPGSAGFCFAFDTHTNSITAMLATTAGEGAGIWSSGQGLSCDPQGTYCYAETGNGDTIPEQGQWGESFIQIKYVSPAATVAASLSIVKGWSPFTDFQRSGQQQVPAGKLAGASMVSEAVRPVGGEMVSPHLALATPVGKIDAQGQPVTLLYPNMASGPFADEDYGSGGPACIFAIGACVTGGKAGIGYEIAVPGFAASTSVTIGTKTGCKQLIDIAWVTMSPGDIDPCPADPKQLDFLANGMTAHWHATPVQFLNPISGKWNIAIGGENAQVHVWQVENPGGLTYLGEGAEYASSDLRGQPPGGMAGSFCSGSSNGNGPTTYLLYCTMPFGDSNRTVTPGHLVVYDPLHIKNGVMPTLWDSADWGAHNPQSEWYCMMDKFLPPYVDGGEIVMPCYDGRVLLLGVSR